MLTSLAVRDFVLIDRLQLGFGPGLTVLTGETGAGKSILLDSLGLALGERGATGLVRAGAETAMVTASFEVGPDHPAHAILAESDLAFDDETLVLRRALGRDGRSRGFVNDQAVGVALLRRLGATLVEIQGQHEQMGLADAAGHRALLDAYGVAPAVVQAARRTHADWRDAATRLAAAEAALDAAAREEEWLRDAADELGRLAPLPDEEDRLAASRLALQRGERRREAIAAAIAELNPRERRSTGPAAALRAAARALAKLAPAEPAADATGDGNGDGDGAGDPRDSLAAQAAAALDRAEDALADADMLLNRLAAEQDDDPRMLEAAEERLFALRAAGRKHGVPPTELPELLASLRERLASLDGGRGELAALEAETRTRRAAFDAACRTLSESRREASGRLERAVTAELAPLRLARARFVVDTRVLPEAGWNETGADAVAFLIAANPGQEPGPLGRVASGGELSRLMLALKVVLAAGSPVGTLVFDEVDSGIGGATASAVGERLSAIAQARQVLVVTHSPQVAARGDDHLTVAKRVARGATTTEISPLDAAARREEIARMLAGAEVTDAARAAASSLLERLV